MTFTKVPDIDRVILEMEQQDYNVLLFILGYGATCARHNDPSRAMEMFRFINRLNIGNPYYVPFEFYE